MKTLYYKIHNSLVTAISDEEALDLEKKGVYYTEGKEIDRIEHSHDEVEDETKPVYAYGEIIIRVYDLDKNSLIPEIKFLDSYTSGGLPSFNFFSPAFFIIAILVAIFLYFTFFGQSDEEINEEPSPSIFSSVSSGSIVVENNTPVTPVTPAPAPTSAPVVDNFVKSDDKLIIEGLELGNKRKDYELQDMQIVLQRTERELDICRNDFHESKNIAKEYLQESLQKTEVINICNSSLLDNNQLYLYLGEYLFNLCEKQESDAKCKEIIYNFYNLRK